MFGKSIWNGDRAALGNLGEVVEYLICNILYIVAPMNASLHKKVVQTGVILNLILKKLAYQGLILCHTGILVHIGGGLHIGFKVVSALKCAVNLLYHIFPVFPIEGFGFKVFV